MQPFTVMLLVSALCLEREAQAPMNLHEWIYCNSSGSRHSWKRKMCPSSSDDIDDGVGQMNHTASLLHCYKCENVKSHSDCKITRCSDLDKYCVMFYHESPGHPISINKYCAPSCPDFNTKIKGGPTISSDCCTTDSCNSGGPSTVKTSYAVLALATVASFFYALRTEL